MSADQDDPSPESLPVRPAPDDVLVAGGSPLSGPAPAQGETVTDGIAAPGSGAVTPPGGFPVHDGYPPHGGRAPQDDYAAQGVPQGGYAPQENYAPPQAYAAQDAYPPQEGYGPPEGHTPPQGYAVHDGYAAQGAQQDAYGAQDAYSAQSGYLPQDDYAQQDAGGPWNGGMPQPGFAPPNDVPHDAVLQDGVLYAGGALPPNAGAPPQGPGFPGMPPMAGGRPPKGGRLKKRLVTGAGVTAVAAAAATVAVVFVSDGGDTGKAHPKPSVTAPSAWSLKAGEELTSGPGFRYQGTFTAGNGTPVQVDLRVTAAGSTIGTLTAGAVKAEVVAVGGDTYIKAGLQFWRDYAGERSHPENFADRWAKAPAAVPGFDVPAVLGAQAIAKLLAEAPADPPAQTVNGVRAYKIKTSEANYLVTAAEPYRLLSVQPAGPVGTRFSVGDLLNPATLFATLRPRVKALVGAADPNLHFDPGKLTFVDCDQNTAGCTVRVPATLSSPDTVPDGARAALRAAIASRGTPLGSCASSAPVPTGRSLVLTCTVQGRAWRTWVKAALDHPGSYPYSAQARVVGEALTKADVKVLLAKLDRERSKVVKSTLSGTPGGASGSPTPRAARTPHTGASGASGAPRMSGRTGGPQAARTGGSGRP